jgi:hypothetical protein
MEGIVLLNSMNMEILLAVTVVLVVIVYIWIFKRVYIRSRKNRKRRIDSFNSALWNGLDNGTISSFDDVQNIYGGIFGGSIGEYSGNYGLSKMLKSFLLCMVNSEKEKNLVAREQIIKWKNEMTQYIKQNDRISPFSELPTPERNILRDASEFLNNEDIESAFRKINELTLVIKSKNDKYSKIESTNKWAVPLSIIGLLSTIFFGIISVIK